MARTVNIAKKLRKIAASLEELASAIDAQTLDKPKKSFPAGNGKSASKKTRRSKKEAAELRKLLRAERKAGVPVAELAAKHGISKAYIYLLKQGLSGLMGSGNSLCLLPTTSNGTCGVAASAHFKQVELETGFEVAISTQNCGFWGAVMDEPEYKIVYSPLCREVTQEGKTVDVKIYRGAEEETWILEVIAEDGSSTVWDDRFESDHDALAELNATLMAEGMSAFNDDGGGQTRH